MRRFEKSFEILEFHVPDAKYSFTSGTILSNVSQSDISQSSEHGMMLIALGWHVFNDNWCLTL